VPPYSAPYLLLEAEKAGAVLTQDLQVARAAAAALMAAITQVALAIPRQLAHLKETLAAPAVTVVLNLLEVAAGVHLLLDQIHRIHQPAALEVLALLVRLPERASLVLAAEAAALM
jgi:hypothetical protein